jgi:hypothetical protein
VLANPKIYAVAEPEVLRTVPAGGPPLKLDKRGCRPHSRLAPSPRPKASRGEADATAKAEGGSGETSIQRPFERPEPCDRYGFASTSHERWSRARLPELRRSFCIGLRYGSFLTGRSAAALPTGL